MITGGNGFIARHLFDTFKSKYVIFCPNSKELNLLDSDSVSECLIKNQFDVVIHAATYDAAPPHSKKDPAKVLEYNLKMYFNLVRCSTLYGKMIYFGSGAEFGRTNWKPKMNEEYFDQYIPEDQYGFSKYLMTKYTLIQKNIFNLRLFAVFGENEDWKVRLISNLCYNAVFDQPLIINQNRKYDFLYIDDLVRIVDWYICHTPKKQIYNVCSGSVTEFKSIAEIILKISGKNQDILLKVEGLGLEYSGDNSLLIEEMGDFEFTLIEDAIKKIYWSFMQNKPLFKKSMDVGSNND